MELVEPVQMNIYQSDTYREDLSSLHLYDEPKDSPAYLIT